MGKTTNPFNQKRSEAVSQNPIFESQNQETKHDAQILISPRCNHIKYVWSCSWDFGPKFYCDFASEVLRLTFSVCCCRLFSSAVFNDQFIEHTPPEIQNTALESVVLIMKAMGIEKVQIFLTFKIWLPKLYCFAIFRSFTKPNQCHEICTGFSDQQKLWFFATMFLPQSLINPSLWQENGELDIFLLRIHVYVVFLNT